MLLGSPSNVGSRLVAPTVTIQESLVLCASTGCPATSRRWWYLPYALVGEIGLNLTIDTIEPFSANVGTGDPKGTQARATACQAAVAWLRAQGSGKLAWKALNDTQ